LCGHVVAGEEQPQVHDGRQIDLSAQVERVRRKTRPWKSIIALLLAIAAGIISHEAHKDAPFGASKLTEHVIAPTMAVAFGVLGAMATYGLAGQSKQLLEPKAGTAHAGVVRYAILILGAFTTLVLTLELFTVPVGQLVLGGALTTVFVGIAAQQALGNVFAGLVLMLARPFRVGEAIRLRAGALGGTIDGVVTDIGITYVRLDTGGSVMSVPNSQVLNAVVGPVPPDEQEEGEEPGLPVVNDAKSTSPGAPEQQQPRPAGPV
jgi:small-conductance mechanosensitive channel